MILSPAERLASGQVFVLTSMHVLVHGNARYEKIANQAREEYMGDQMKQLEEHLKIS